MGLADLLDDDKPSSEVVGVVCVVFYAMFPVHCLIRAPSTTKHFSHIAVQERSVSPDESNQKSRAMGLAGLILPEDEPSLFDRARVSCAFCSC